jgi:phosphate transport system permease protein
MNRIRRERLVGNLFFLATIIPILLVIVIVIALWLRTRPIMEIASIWDLLTGQTIWVTVVAMVLAVPVCLLTSIYLSEYAHSTIRTVMKPLLDLLAAIPSVVYGVWGVILIVPWVHNSITPFLGHWLGFIPIFVTKNPTGYGILAGGIVLAVMVAPFIIAISYEVLQAVPKGLREASLAIGATNWQTIKYAVVPQTLTGLMAGIVLGASRALGETMAVMMVVGNVVRMPKSIFDPAYPLPALIANNYGEMLSIPLYDAALLGAALILLVVVLVFNIISTLILRRIVGRSFR